MEDCRFIDDAVKEIEVEGGFMEDIFREVWKEFMYVEEGESVMC